MENIKQGKIHESMLKFHGLFKGIKGVKKKAFKGAYHELATLISEVRPILYQCDLYFLQRPILINDKEYMQTTIFHKDGSFISDDGIHLDATDKGKDSVMQSVGSAQTYARRYGLSAILGLAEHNEEDLDNPDVKPTGNGGKSHRVNKIAEKPDHVGELLKAEYPEIYKGLEECKGKLSNHLLKLTAEIKTMHDPKSKWKPELSKDYMDFCQYIKSTCNT